MYHPVDAHYILTLKVCAETVLPRLNHIKHSHAHQADTFDEDWEIIRTQGTAVAPLTGTFRTGGGEGGGGGGGQSTGLLGRYVV